MKRHSGFTIIEIMLVTMIIGILAVVAIRAMNSYSVRAKISEAVLALSACRTVVGEIFMSADALPGTSDSFGCETTNSSRYVSRVSTTAEGVIKVEVRGVGDLRVDGRDISLAPLDNTGVLMTDVGRVARWRCGAAVDGTDVNAEFLPSTCRGN